MTAPSACRSEECGGKPWETTHAPDSFPGSLHGYCFMCAFWVDHAANPNAGTVITQTRRGRERYEFDPAEPVVDASYGMRGHGGRRWRIRFADGRTAETNNLWSQGEIPERFYGLFPLNAELESAEQPRSLIAAALSGEVPR